MKRTLPAALLALCVLALIAVRFAQPLLDGDIFWHMAYARGMLLNHTLIPDHTAFSWTPTSNAYIYCAWLSEIFFYGIWKTFGLAGLFALRYAVVLTIMGMLAWFARRMGLLSSTATWLVLLICLLSSIAGTVVKPELLSLLLLHSMVALYFGARLAARSGSDARPWLYAVPLLMTLWVNMHGAFILAAPFLLLTALGECLTRRFSPGLAMGERSFRHLLLAWGLCGIAVLLTPYGYRYPWQLIQEMILHDVARPDVSWNAAYQSIFTPAVAAYHFVNYLVLMIGVLAALFIVQARRAPAGQRVDWALLLVNLAYIPLFIVYLRSTFFWPAVFAYSALFLIHVGRSWLPRWPSVTAVAIPAMFAFLVARAGYDIRHNPESGAWTGFGISYLNPVEEAQYLREARLSSRLINVFNSGAYLLWELNPTYKVMLDSRSFPYLSWFGDQRAFTQGRVFEQFLAKYPADVAVIDLLWENLLRNFLRAPEWRPVYYGASAAVFVRVGSPFTPPPQQASPQRFNQLRNGNTALRVYRFATAAGDYATAWQVLEHIENDLIQESDPGVLATARAYRAAHEALRARKYAQAYELLRSVFANQPMAERDRVLVTLLESRFRRILAKQDPAVFDAALARLVSAD